MHARPEGTATTRETRSGRTAALLLTLAATTAAGARPVSAQALQHPSWMDVDRADSTVTLDITARPETNSGYDYNGYHDGDATIVVPEGYRVTIHFRNGTAATPHSLAISTREPPFPALIQEAELAFEGAGTPGSMEMRSATQPGRSDTIRFTADQAGHYAMICHLPGHATAGMWIHFDVSSGAEAGLRTGHG